MLTREFLKRMNSNFGDRVKIVVNGKMYRGILIPRADDEFITLKLENGYNVGFSISRIESFEVEERKVFDFEKGIKKEEKKEKKEKKEKVGKGYISVIGVGGTIACRVDYRTGAVYPSISSDDIILSFPELAEKKKKMKVLSLFNIFSEDMRPEHWVEIAESVYDEIKRGAGGVIILHGTDTMHYTSAALSFMLNTPVPVVFVGAQRSSDRGSSDNYGNLLSSFLIAESDIAEIGVCMHGSVNDDFCYFHKGTKVRKMHTSRRNAFKSVNSRPIARVWWEKKKIEILSEYKKRGEGGVSLDTRINPNISLVYVHPGIKKEVFDFDCDGFVVAGTGLGHVPNYLIEKIKKVASEKPVVIAPQTIFGRINMNVYSSGRELIRAGVIGNLCDWTPECALVKLMIATARYKKLEEIKKFMLTNVCGEISEVSKCDFYEM